MSDFGGIAANRNRKMRGMHPSFEDVEPVVGMASKFSSVSPSCLSLFASVDGEAGDLRIQGIEFRRSGTRGEPRANS